jgi:TolB protein
MKLNLAVSIAMLTVANCTSPAAAQDRLFVDIKEGVMAPLAIGIPAIASDIQVEAGTDGDIGPTLASIIRADLATSSFFRVVDAPSAAFTDDKSLLSAFSAKGAQALVIGRPTRAAEGMLVYSCALYDVFSGTIETAREFRVSQRQWRRAAHKCADLVFAHATGYSGHFDTRFVLVSSGAAAGETATRLIAVDVDGASPAELLNNGELVAMPQFSPDNRSALFVAYQSDMPRIVLFDLESGRRTLLQLPAGLPSAARFSPDGSRAVLALSQDGNTDLYEYEFAVGRSRRLTDMTGIDTSPSYSPDGKSIVFESDRSGQPQLYVMRLDGSDQRRISFGREHGSPAWSPDGSLIAFVTRTSEGQQIGVMAPDGSKRRILTEGGHDEDPSWAPSGRAVSFQRLNQNSSPPEIWITDVAGRVQYRIALPLAGSEPHWSETLP